MSFLFPPGRRNERTLHNYISDPKQCVQLLQMTNFLKKYKLHIHKNMNA